MKVYLKTIGCRVNQVETESLRERFAALGHASAAAPEEADLVVLNTCSVTARADRDCLAFLRRTAASNPRAAIAVTGCLATLEPRKILAAAPAASLFTNAQKENIPAAFCGGPAGAEFFAVERSHGKARAFMKVQDGCDLKCSYCLVSLARSELKSKPLAAAAAEAGRLAAAGFSEIVLCGTRLGKYRCPETGAGLAALAGRLFSLGGDFRIRFSSIEAGELTPELLAALRAGGDKFCDYFHLPLQAGSDKVLREMARPFGTERYAAKVRELRALFPGAGVYADIIAGYPTETGADFEDGFAFVRGLGLAGLHVFSFSPRPGTPAAALKPLPAGVVTARSEALRGLDGQLRSAFAAAQLGRELQVLAIRNSGGRCRALASNFADVELAGPRRRGSLLRCRVTAARGGACSAEASP